MMQMLAMFREKEKFLLKKLLLLSPLVRKIVQELKEEDISCYKYSFTYEEIHCYKYSYIQKKKEAKASLKKSVNAKEILRLSITIRIRGEHMLTSY